MSHCVFGEISLLICCYGGFGNFSYFGFREFTVQGSRADSFLLGCVLLLERLASRMLEPHFSNKISLSSEKFQSKCPTGFLFYCIIFDLQFFFLSA